MSSRLGRWRRRTRGRPRVLVHHPGIAVDEREVGRHGEDGPPSPPPPSGASRWPFAGDVGVEGCVHPRQPRTGWPVRPGCPPPSRTVDGGGRPPRSASPAALSERGVIAQMTRSGRVDWAAMDARSPRRTLLLVGHDDDGHAGTSGDVGAALLDHAADAADQPTGGSAEGRTSHERRRRAVGAPASAVLRAGRSPCPGVGDRGCEPGRQRTGDAAAR